LEGEAIVPRELEKKGLGGGGHCGKGVEKKREKICLGLKLRADSLIWNTVMILCQVTVL